jgi:multicomponent Na+:H+ antiporter subunit G
MTVFDILGVLLLAFGVFFFVVGVAGIIRLPDAYSRLHASGKVATLGLFGLLVGGGVLMPELMPRLLLLGLFFLMTAPAASHVIALMERTRKRKDREGI